MPKAAESSPVAAPPAWLVPISGPPLRSIELQAKGGGITIGRQDTCDVRLASDAVSRQHARLCYQRGSWHLVDLGSRWGTFLNGCRVSPDADVPLQAGDLIRINPWTFNFSSRVTSRRTVHSIDDTEQRHTLVRSIHPDRGGAMAEDRLALLLEAAASLQAATDESALAEALLEAACRGSGLNNAAVVRSVDAEGEVEVIAQRPLSAEKGFSFSRSLLAVASSGQIAEFSPSGGDGSQSMIQMQVDAALAVPLMLDTTVAACLYLDARGGAGRADVVPPRGWHAAVSFCLALGRIASLALANLMRIDMQRRAALIEMELRAAAEAQRWILPRREVTLGPLRCYGESRPGRFVGGDFFDIIPLADGRVALALGDVAGKGVPASILMTAAQGFLHAALAQSGDVEVAVNQLHRFIAPRKPDDRFLTLWLGVLDVRKNLLHYIDAGHGYAFLLGPDRAIQTLDSGDNVPVGVQDESNYQAATVSLPPSGQLLVVSDGIIEQPAPGVDPDAPPREFGSAGVRALAGDLSQSPHPIELLFASVTAHAAAATLSDDATALLTRW